MILKTFYKFILLAAVFSLSACSSTATGMQFMDKSPRGIKVINITKELDSRAYQTAEIHCSKYSKIPRILKTIKQTEDYELVQKSTVIFECRRP